MTSLILRTTAIFLVILMLVFSVWILLRGHNAPGGGFSAGLITASAFTVHLIAHGVTRLRRLLLVALPLTLSAGLLCVLLSGCIGWWSGQSFLSAQWITIHINDLTLYLGTPLLFDFGIFLVVASSVLLMVLALRED